MKWLTFFFTLLIILIIVLADLGELGFLKLLIHSPYAKIA